MALILRSTNKFKKLFDNNEHNYDFPILVQLLSKLSEDVLTEILVRVPTDVLVLLCPIWRNLISSPLFVDLQLRRADSIHVVQSLYPDGPNRKARLSIVDCTRKKNCIDLVSDHITNKWDRPTLWGSCGGLLAFWNSCERGCISIVNPITGEKRDIVTPTSLNGRLCGFFFDRFQGRYKLLYVHASKLKVNDDVYYTFDLSENVWRKLDIIKYGLDIRPGIEYIPVIVGDALHWIGEFPYTIYCSKMVVVFKIETQELYSLSHPNVNNRGNSISATTTCDYFRIHQSFRQLIAKDGQLYFCQTIVEESAVVNLWLLEDYENWGSWVKKFKVNLVSIHKMFLSIESSYFYLPYLLQRLKIWSPQNGSNEILVTCQSCYDRKGLYGYNLETHRSRQLEKSASKSDMDCYIVLPYIKTILSPNSLSPMF